MPSLASMLRAWQAAALHERSCISHTSNISGMGVLTRQEALASNRAHKDLAMEFELRAQATETVLCRTERRT